MTSICATCAVEHADRPEVCAICADERQYVPAGGQVWTSLAVLAADGCTAEIAELEPDLFAVTTSPGVGIGQTAKLVRTRQGCVLFDPVGFVDDDVAARVRALGEVVAIVPSHPHMFGVQVEWSRRLGGVPVLVAEADAGWVARPDPSIETWTGDRELLPGVTITQPGGHFPGSAVLHWAAGAEGRGVLLAGDTIMANPDRTSVSFMRSYPNRIPLSGAVAQRVAAHVVRFTFDRLYNNFEGVVPTGARDAVLRSAERHAAWTNGDNDHLT
ncbi:hydrolase [Paraoerskovia sediminicola]|uniref:Hydrolase n=1 Tax=Paraoerskovia sediminicola TaxID=1138587 RepID=A0ABN6XAL2_9CELL|nr:hydrolase [Paraoerskovia sediminicola]BDZ41832.1 hydrolase [Paraoerskovia sediminicola]